MSTGPKIGLLPSLHGQAGTWLGCLLSWYNFLILYVFHNFVIWQVVKVFILSRLKIESALIKQAQEGVDPVEKNAAENLKNLLLVNHITVIHC